MLVEDGFRHSRRFGHIVFRYGGSIASLLVTEGAPPATAELEPLEGSVRVASLPAGRSIGCVVADLDRDRTLRLAQALVDPLSRHLT